MKQLLVRLVMATVLVSGMLLSVNSAQAASTTIVINEIDCRGNDWIEIGNRTTKSINISGWFLSDKALDSTAPGHVYTFPAGTRIPAKGRLVVQQSGTGNKRLGFGIDCLKGGTIKIGYQNGSTISEVDSVSVPLIAPKTLKTKTNPLLFSNSDRFPSLLRRIALSFIFFTKRQM